MIFTKRLLLAPGDIKLNYEWRSKRCRSAGVRIVRHRLFSLEQQIKNVLLWRLHKFDLQLSN